jgi:hypothetical protein
VRILSVLKYLNDTQTARLWAKIKAGFVAKSGDTMTGALTLAGDPVSDLQAATKKYVDDNAGALPSQTGQSGKFLTTDGTDASWGDVDSLPSQTGQSGKYLTTNGTSASWETVDALPSQSGKNGKYLKTNGTAASWEDGPAQTAKIWTGYCNTRADVVPKVVVLDDPTGFSLDADTRIAVMFYNGIEIPSTASPSLNVNDTGNKNLNIPKGINNFVDDRNKLICARGETCLFSYSPGLGAYGGWMLETSGLLLSKAYDKADAALPKAGGTMTGALTLSGAPTNNLHAATKKYVDDAVGGIETLLASI